MVVIHLGYALLFVLNVIKGINDISSKMFIPSVSSSFFNQNIGRLIDISVLLAMVTDIIYAGYLLFCFIMSIRSEYIKMKELNV